MPLIRKPQAPGSPPAAAPPAADSVDGRWDIIRAFAAKKDISALAAILKNEKNARLRGAIFTGLTQIGTLEAAEALLPAFRSDDSGLRTGALDALRAMSHVVQPMLGALLTDSDADVRLLACEIVRHLDSQDATQLLCRLLERETEANVVGAAVEVLSEVGNADALPLLSACADRFKKDPFLPFAIQVASDRLRTRSAP